MLDRMLRRGGAQTRQDRSAPPMLIVGLGNPGPRYAGTRHNVGFRCIDLLSERSGVRLNDKRKHAVIGQGVIAGRPVVLAKPRTFVNASGLAVQYAATRFGARPANILVVLDDMDLPPGQMRLRASGGSGGHNGLNSINAELGTTEYPRLRIGIGRPAGNAIAHVLGPLSGEEESALSETLAQALELIEVWVEHGVQRAMNLFN